MKSLIYVKERKIPFIVEGGLKIVYYPNCDIPFAEIPCSSNTLYVNMNEVRCVVAQSDEGVVRNGLAMNVYGDPQIEIES